jgi:hypothetical protein
MLFICRVTLKSNVHLIFFTTGLWYGTILSEDMYQFRYKMPQVMFCHRSFSDTEASVTSSPTQNVRWAQFGNTGKQVIISLQLETPERRVTGLMKYSYWSMGTKLQRSEYSKKSSKCRSLSLPGHEHEMGNKACVVVSIIVLWWGRKWLLGRKWNNGKFIFNTTFDETKFGKCLLMSSTKCSLFLCIIWDATECSTCL